MSFLKFSPNLFLEKQELDRFKRFIDDTGFRNFLLQNSNTFGFVRKENEIFTNALVQEDVGLTVKINPIVAIDNNGNIILNEDGVSQLAIPSDSNWYWIKAVYQPKTEEKGTFSVDSSGNLVCTTADAELLTILRGQPNYPSRITFTNATNNTLEYDVLEVVDNNNAVLQGSFTSESGLTIAVVGTFTNGYVPLTSEKFIFQYDSCAITLVQHNLATPPTHATGSFFLARCKNNGATMFIEDKRTEIWQTNANYFLRNLDTTGNPLFGIEQVTYDDKLSTKVDNIMQVAWALETLSYSVNLKLDTITITSATGGIFKSTNFNTLFSDGDFDGWRLYTADGKYYKIATSTLVSGNIELVMESLDGTSFFSDSNSLTPITQNLLITPNVEEIQIICTPDSGSSNAIVDKVFTFPINRNHGKINLNVYNATTASYNILYRYKHIKDYSPTFTPPSDAVGYYAEDQFDSDGNLVVSPVRTPYTSSPTAGYITLKLHPDAYSNFETRIDLGDKSGVDTSSLASSGVKTLVVGSDRQYQHYTGSLLTLFGDLNISLQTLNVNGDSCRNGNTFFLHFKQRIDLNGHSLKIGTDYSGGTLTTVLKTFTKGDTDFLTYSDAGLFFQCTFDDSGTWIINSVNEAPISSSITYDSTYTCTGTLTLIPSLTFTTPNDGITRRYLMMYKGVGSLDSNPTANKITTRLYDTTNVVQLDSTELSNSSNEPISGTMSMIYMGTVAPNITIQVKAEITGSDGGGVIDRSKFIIIEQK